MRKTLRSGIFHTLALIITALYVVPLASIFLVALAPADRELQFGIPDEFAWSNFAEAMRAENFPLFFANSLVVSLASTVLQVLLCAMAGYALAKMPIPGKKTIMLVLIALIIVPPEVMMVPLFVIVTHVPFAGGNDLWGNGGSGLLDTYAALVVPHVISALCIFLMRQFYLDLPDELGESARVDGASEGRIFWQIYTPLALPAVAVVSVLAFQGAWNDFLWPLVSVKSNDMRTLQLGLAVFYQENSTQWSLLMAAVILMTLPIVVIFLFGQRYFTAGVSAGGVKE